MCSYMLSLTSYKKNFTHLIASFLFNCFKILIMKSFITWVSLQQSGLSQIFLKPFLSHSHCFSLGTEQCICPKPDQHLKDSKSLRSSKGEVVIKAQMKAA